MENTECTESQDNIAGFEIVGKFMNPNTFLVELYVLARIDFKKDRSYTIQRFHDTEVKVFISACMNFGLRSYQLLDDYHDCIARSFIVSKRLANAISGKNFYFKNVFNEFLTINIV